MGDKFVSWEPLCHHFFTESEWVFFAVHVVTWQDRDRFCKHGSSICRSGPHYDALRIICAEKHTLIQNHIIDFRVKLSNFSKEFQNWSQIWEKCTVHTVKTWFCPNFMILRCQKNPVQSVRQNNFWQQNIKFQNICDYWLYWNLSKNWRKDSIPENLKILVSGYLIIINT